MSKTSPLPPLKPEQLTETAQKAVRAAQRSAEKLREHKNKLGHKLVIVEDGEMKIVLP